MGVRYLIVAMDRTQHIFGAEEFIEKAKERWPDCLVFIDDPNKYVTDAAVRVDHDGTAPSTMINHFPDNRMLTTNGDLSMTAEVAVWVRELHPDPDLALWLIDNSFCAHVVLHPGITTDEVNANWVDHREHDPYEEYPQYFPME